MAFCSNCGKNIDNGVKFCPYCGSSVNSSNNEPVVQLSQNQSSVTDTGKDSEIKKTLNVMALIGFISGLISWFLNFFGIVGIIACIFSGIGLGKFNKETENNKWMAIIGLISGGINIIYALVQITKLL